MKQGQVVRLRGGVRGEVWPRWGVGWAICAQNPATGGLSNHWITLHEVGNVSGFNPILVMDAWEHAFILDYAPADRPKYIDAFFSNIDWSVVQNRLKRGSMAPAA